MHTFKRFSTSHFWLNLSSWSLTGLTSLARLIYQVAFICLPARLLIGRNAVASLINLPSSHLVSANACLFHEVDVHVAESVLSVYRHFVHNLSGLWAFVFSIYIVPGEFFFLRPRSLLQFPMSLSRDSWSHWTSHPFAMLKISDKHSYLDVVVVEFMKWYWLG